MSIITAVKHIKSEVVFYYNLAKDTEGASGIEYAIIAGLAAAALIILMGDIGTVISGFSKKILAILPTS